MAEPSILPLAFEGVAYQAERPSAGWQELRFHLEAGPLTVVLGPNGAGKSLLLRLAQGLIDAERWARSPGTAGRSPRCAGIMALAFQRPVLLRRSAAANVAYPLKLRGITRDRPAEARVDEALARVGLSALAERPARVLSGGEQQRSRAGPGLGQRAGGPVARRADRQPGPGGNPGGRGDRRRLSRRPAPRSS